MAIKIKKRSAKRLNEIQRFSLWRVIEHSVLLLLFCLLAFSGFAQRFNHLDISQSVLKFVGGQAVLGSIHYMSGVLFLALFVLHLFVAVFGILHKGWLPTMLVSGQDFLNMVGDIRYYLGTEDRPAKCERYSYKEKFVYWAVMTSSIFMILSGVVLYFPDISVMLFPAVVIPAAKIMHDGVALILLLLAFWHLYDSIFSPGSFPLNTSIFTGQISLEKMEREHPLELQSIENNPSSVNEGIGKKCKKE